MELSIIIPHFNSPRLLEKLIASIPVREDIQIIVIDDNSTVDKEIYQRLVKNTSASHHVLFLKNNSGKKGAGACRNIGLKWSTGHWVLFADADDYFVEGFYQKIKRFFNSEYDVIFFMPTSMELDTGKP